MARWAHINVKLHFLISILVLITVIKGHWPVTVPMKGLQSHLKCLNYREFSVLDLDAASMFIAFCLSLYYTNVRYNDKLEYKNLQVSLLKITIFLKS